MAYLVCRKDMLLQQARSGRLGWSLNLMLALFCCVRLLS